jgi:hypothetical protein
MIYFSNWRSNQLVLTFTPQCQAQNYGCLCCCSTMKCTACFNSKQVGIITYLAVYLRHSNLNYWCTRHGSSSTQCSQSVLLLVAARSLTGCVRAYEVNWSDCKAIDASAMSKLQGIHCHVLNANSRSMSANQQPRQPCKNNYVLERRTYG